MFCLLERCSIDKLIERETWWISTKEATNPAKGYNRKSIADSNLGIKWSVGARAKMSEGARRRMSRPGELERLAEVGRAAASDPDVIARVSAKKKGQRHTEEAKAKISAASKGRVVSKETVQKRLATWRSRGHHVMSEEQKDKIRRTKMGRKDSDEVKAKKAAKIRSRMSTQEGKDQLVACLAKRWEDPEQRKRTSERMKLYWAARRGQTTVQGQTDEISS